MKTSSKSVAKMATLKLQLSEAAVENLETIARERGETIPELLKTWAREDHELASFTLRRSGMPPLSFTGVEIAGASSRTVSGPNANRWTEASLYRTKGGKIVVSIIHRTCWVNESDTFAAASFEMAADAIEWLKSDGVLPAVHHDLLDKAAKADAEFAAAFVEHVE